MRTTTAWMVAFLLGTSLLVASPASAAFGALVELPEAPIYSPYGGPATVTFTFEPSDPATIFTVRLRQPGHGTIKEKGYLVDPATQTSPRPVSFPWRDLAVTSATDYVVDVRRSDDGTVLASEPFTLWPRLVSNLSAAPSPFYPLIQDGYKDRTKIGFTLAADTVDTVVHVFRDDVYGRCCGTEIRTDDLGPLPHGTHRWVWDGTDDGSSTAPKGTYYVRIEATDTGAVTRSSKAQKVALTKGWIRRTATKDKDGSAYARVADERQTAIGGDCFASRDPASRTASILCANAEISVFWRWALDDGDRIESVSFETDGGYHGCHTTEGHTKTESYMRVSPTSTCTVYTATIRYSYPVQV